MFDFIGIGVLVALLALFAWATRQAWRSQQAWLKWGGGLLSGLLTLVCVLALGLALVGYYRLNARHPNPVADLKAAGTPEQIARGEGFARFCAGCHSPNAQLPLTGNDFAADGPPLGTFYAPNLTPVHLGDWSDGEIVRAIREGIGKQGRSLLVMPTERFRHLSDEDVLAIVAYLRAQPPVEPDTPPLQVSATGAMLLNVLPFFSNQPPIDGPVVAPPRAATPTYGHYLAVTIGCSECHGENLGGGIETFGPPQGPDLTRLTQRWSESDFISTMRTGERPTGGQLRDTMPWQAISAFASDDDLKAIYAYLATLPPAASR
jgi:mono/diheme cytochrome c family protein